MDKDLAKDPLEGEEIDQILWADVEFISLCLEPVSEIRAMYKSKGKNAVQVRPLVKSFDEEKGLLTTVMAAPSLPDFDGEAWTPEAIQSAAYGFLARGGKIDTEHDGKPRDDVKVVESFIIQKGDPRFDEVHYGDRILTSEDLAGGWGGVLKLESEEARALYREKGWLGVSPGGKYVTAKDLSVLEMSKAKLGEIKNRFTRMIRGLMRSESGFENLHMTINVPPPGVDVFTGEARRPSFHISIDGNLQ